MIGVYDSGFGGLSVLRELHTRLPDRDFLYLADSGRAPYGGRDCDTLLDFAEQCVERLFDQGCRLVVVACHTISCVALRHLQRRYAGPDSGRRILGVTIPAAEAAVAMSRGHIGILGTARTVASHTFEVEIAKLGKHVVSQRAAPLLAPLVEEGLENTDIARQVVAHYLRDFGPVDTLVLACTHYPLLMTAFLEASQAKVLDPAPFVAQRLADWLTRHPEFDAPATDAVSNGAASVHGASSSAASDGAASNRAASVPVASRGTVRVQCTSDPHTFREHATRFFGSELTDVVRLGEQRGRLELHVPDHVVVGQVVR